MYAYESMEIIHEVVALLLVPAWDRKCSIANRRTQLGRYDRCAIDYEFALSRGVRFPVQQGGKVFPAAAGEFLCDPLRLQGRSRRNGCAKSTLIRWLAGSKFIPSEVNRALRRLSKTMRRAMASAVSRRSLPK